MASKKLLVMAIFSVMLVCMSMSGSRAARPEPASPISSGTDRINKHRINHLMHQVSLEEKGKEKKTMLRQGKEGIITETMGQQEEQENPCHEQHDEGKAAADEEQSLMRRTLVAHTDYIYTQGKHN